MNKKTTSQVNDDLKFLDHNDDQYKEILDNVEINKNTDSETTNLINFRVINTKNPYPQKDNTQE